MMNHRLISTVCFALLFVLSSLSSTPHPVTAADAEQIVQTAGVTGGVIVHLECGDGKLTAALAGQGPFLVQGLDTDPDQVAAARKHIQQLGLYGQVTVDQLRGPRLPYADNVVNLVVQGVGCQVSEAEIQRVLCPGGVTISFQPPASSLQPIKKPWPANIDQWTHFLYDASNNAVSQDQVVAPPKHFQWIAGPQWSRSHDHLSSVSAMVSAKGRIFYIIDEAPTAAAGIESKWALIARDAFNGILLWKRPIGSWEGHLRDFRTGPTELQRRLVAVGDRVYVTLGYGQPVTALNAATGETVKAYAETDNALEIIFHQGRLFVVVGDRVPDNVDGAAKPVRPQQVWHWWPIYEEKPPAKHLVALDADSGERLWNKDDADTARLMPTTLAAAGARVYFHSPDEVLALNADTGEVYWRTDRPVNRRRPTWSAPTLAIHGNVIISADRSDNAPPPDLADSEQEDLWVVSSRGGQAPVGKMIAFDLNTGRRLWEADCKECYNAPVDVLVADDLVWSGNLVGKNEPGITAGLDLNTGQVARQRPKDQEFFNIVMGHHRCYRNKATENYLVMGRDGIEFIDVKTGEGFGNHWVRGSCQLGVMPANGLIYASQHSCACHIESKLNSFNALAPERWEESTGEGVEEWKSGSVEEYQSARLERGPAYPAPELQAPASALQPPASWPTYRGDAARSGSTAATVATKLQPAWQTSLPGGRLSSVVIADGRLLVAAIDAHTVYALNADDGQVLWSFTAGGRIDSPPTIDRGTAIFGSADGWIYSVRASDGQLAWRFRAAPADCRFVAYGQFESVSPLHGSVLVHDGSVYAVAGRTTFLDDGIRLVRLDAATGELLAEVMVDAPALPDILSYDGNSLFMRHRRFNLDFGAEPANVSHLYSSAGFLDDSWWHRTYWQFGTSMGSGWGSWPNSGARVPAGRLMSIAGDQIYGFGRLNQYHRDGSHVGLGRAQYLLYACHHSPEAAKPAAKPRAAQPAAGEFDYRWSQRLPLLGRAMVVCGDTLFIAGPPDVFVQGPEDVTDPYHIESPAALREQDAALANQRGGLLQSISTADGSKLAEYPLAAPPAWDSLAATQGRLYLSTTAGSVICLESTE